MKSRTLKILILILMMTLAFMLGACDKSDTSGSADNTTNGSTAMTSSTSGTTAASSTTTSTTAPTTPITSPTTTTTPSVTSAPNETPGSDAGTNSLTGLPLADPSRAKARPVALMINNIKVATPQIGINSADLYYEMVVEGNITRMLAVFADSKSIPELGSIRSARTDYIDFAGGHDAILVHFGASDHANDQMRKLKTADIDLMNTPSAYWRDSEWARTRDSEHSVKTTGKLITEAIENQGLRNTASEPLRFAFGFQPAGQVKPAADPAASPASSVSVTFSSYVTAVFNYDAKTGLYAKSQFGKPQIDLADNKPLSVTNLFVVRTEINRVTPAAKWMDADLSAGSGYYVSKGAKVPIKWKKGQVSNPFNFTLEDGTPLQINRGKTYICVQDTSQTIKFN